jgi:histone acetyltransferase (RNA polymerase elongator complex component)
VKIAEILPDDVRIYPTLVLAGTQLGLDYLNQRYIPLSIEEAIDWTVPVLQLFLQKGLNVIKVGLHPSESYTDPEKFLSGPFHPSFREMVMTKIWQHLFLGISKSLLGKEITIEVNGSSINYAIGYKSINSNLLKDKFKNISFRINDAIEDLSYEVYHS